MALGMLLHPQASWEAIEAEPPERRGLLVGYVAPLAAVPAICGVAGPLMFGFNIANIGVHMSTLGLVMGGAAGWLATLVGVYLLALFVSAIAPRFGGEHGRGRALKLVAYAGTALWIGGLAQLYPNLGILVGVLAGLYSLYALYLGLPRLMRIPEDRRLNAFAVVLLALLALATVRGLVTAKATELGGPLSASYAAPR